MGVSEQDEIEKYALHSLTVVMNKDQILKNQLTTLEVEHELQARELQELREALQVAKDEESIIPGTNVLKARQAEMRRESQRRLDRNEQEKASLSSDAVAHREETRRLEMELQQTAALHAEADTEHAELRRSLQVKSRQDLQDFEWQKEELEREKDELMKEQMRTQERVRILDERLPKMRRDADDIIRRAEKIWQVPNFQKQDPVPVDHPPRHGDTGYLLGASSRPPSHASSAEDIRLAHLRNRVDGSLLSRVEGHGAVRPPQTL